jgi:hypothetical protein
VKHATQPDFDTAGVITVQRFRYGRFSLLVWKCTRSVQGGLIGVECQLRLSQQGELIQLRMAGLFTDAPHRVSMVETRAELPAAMRSEYGAWVTQTVQSSLLWLRQVVALSPAERLNLIE